MKSPAQPFYDAQHLHLAILAEPVSALDFNGSRAEGHHLPHPGKGLPVELVFGRRFQQVGGIQYAASPGRYFLVAPAFSIILVKRFSSGLQKKASHSEWDASDSSINVISNDIAKIQIII